MSAPDRDRLLALLREHSFERRKIVLSSGKESDFYIDCKKTALLAEGHLHIGGLFLAQVPDDAVAVGGMTLGADPLASAVATCAAMAGRDLDAFIVRKEPKGHGTGQWIERPAGLSDGARVVVLEDVITTGGSTIRAIERIREEGLEPIRVLTLVDRQEGGRENVEATGVPVSALFTRADFMGDEA